MRVKTGYTEPITLDGSSISFATYRPAKPSELSEVHPPEDVARFRGGKLHPWAGADCSVSYDSEGVVCLQVGDERTYVHKDELIHVIRFAKGGMGV